MEHTTPCLCTSGLNYGQCCYLYHSSQQTATHAEVLMRSRFTAYVMRNADYLLATWDKSTRPADIDFSKDTVEWYQLEIINKKKGGIKDTKGLVDFKAYYRHDGQEHVMSELSRFRKIDEHWYYQGGVVKSIGKVGENTNWGRNAPCHCGSGKKFKRCCGKD